MKPENSGKMEDSEQTVAPGSDSESALLILMEDHKRVRKLFADFKKFKQSQDGADAEKADLVRQICQELLIHAQVEEEIFYPAVREAIADQDIMDEADVEHDGAKNLIEQIQAMDADESHFDAKVKVLGEMIDHHVTEEREKMFPQARKSGLDLKAMVPQLEERKAQVKQELSEGVAAS